MFYYMFYYWRRQRELRKEIAQISKQYNKRLSEAETRERYNEIEAEAKSKVQQPLSILEGLITWRIQRDAAKFGIDIPTPEVSRGSWEVDPYTEKTYLSSKGKADITRAISEARLDYWERWARLLLPILSMLIAIIALLRK